MTDDGVVWETPPTHPGGGPTHFKWIPLLTPLMQRPNEWAKVDVRTRPALARAMAYQLRRHTRGLETSVNIPPGRWEFTSRTMPATGPVPSMPATSDPRTVPNDPYLRPHTPRPDDPQGWM